jgi:hypothetical protein
LTIPYDTCAVAVGHFTVTLAEEMKGKGVHILFFGIDDLGGPHIGQNTRSRGMGRLLHPGAGLEEPPAPNGKLVDRLIEVLHTTR